MTIKLLATIAAMTITELCGDHMHEIMAAQMIDFLARKIPATFLPVLHGDENRWRSSHRALRYESRIYLPMALRSRVTSLFHDNGESNYFRVVLGTGLEHPAVVQVLTRKTLRFGSSTVQNPDLQHLARAYPAQ
jgi:hypothetical protein